MPCLVLDAMGVIFAAADDVAELLIPFIAERGGVSDEATIRSAYLEASLGGIDADEFWTRVMLTPELEDEFLSRHRLNPGMAELLALAGTGGIPVWCLSNDVGRWSDKLRRNLGIEPRLTGAVISGDVGLRKPDPGIYRILLDRCGLDAGDLLFVDDRENNVAAARNLGIESLLFEPADGIDTITAWVLRHGGP